MVLFWKGKYGNVRCEERKYRNENRISLYDHNVSDDECGTYRL